MKHEGPAIETLLRKLEDTPPDFLENPAGSEGQYRRYAALISDLFLKTGTVLNAEILTRYAAANTPAQRNTLLLRSLTCWLLSAEEFAAALSLATLERILNETVPQLAAEYPAEKYAADAERREEFARLLLADCELRPRGETRAQSEDRLQSLSSAAKRSIIKASRESEKRAREIREALARKAAQDAADKYTRD